MTGGGDLDEAQHEELEETLGETSGEEAEAIVDVEDVDESGGTGDGEADAPVAFDEAINENDPDPTAGASDIGGLAGGIDVDDAREGSNRR